jgi:FkbM family methyltransferase
MSDSGPNAPTSGGVRRRDLLAGGLGGLAGLAAGAVTGRTLLAKGAATPSVAPPTELQLPHGAKLSFAQFGDDLVANSLFMCTDYKNPTYLDIGAADPDIDNNTYIFYLTGSHGVLVEPNVFQTERLRSMRPRDTVLVAGIGTQDFAEADFYVMSSSGLNTFDKEQAERLARESEHKIVKVIKMPMLGINRVIAEHFGGKAPDFISIDIEGLDYAVLKTLDFAKYRPKVICAETLITNTHRHNPDITKLMTENGYEVRGMTFANTLYIDKKLLRA